MPARGAVNRAVDARVAATPATRDRTVDLLRVFAAGVVVVWHWTLSLTHRAADGAFLMPNPIDAVPLGWLGTWLLQVMPVFFLVGGFANLTSWEAAGRRTGRFLRARLSRLLVPTGVWLAVWALAECALLVAVPGYRGLLDHGVIVLVPLWFLGAYLVVVLLVPLTAAAHRGAPLATVALLGAAVVAVDVARFGAGLEAFGLVNTALVWVFVHQLGYVWRDGALDRAGWCWGLAVGGLAGLIAVVLLGHPASMVATEGSELSPMFPTTAGIATLAVFQLGVVALLRPVLAAWLRRRRVWKVVVAGNSVVLTVYLWHMTALVLALALFEAAGLPLHDAPTAAWWAQRPLWLLVPGLALAVLVAVFARVELRRAPGAAGRPTLEP